MTEDEMVGWHHRLNGYGFGWIQGVGDGQGGMACCSPWGPKESDTTERVSTDSLVQLLSRLTPYNSMNRSMSSLPIHHQLLESTQTHVH